MNKNRYKQLAASYNNNFYTGRVKIKTDHPVLALKGKNALLTIFDGKKERDVIDANSGTFGPVSIVGYSNKYVLDAISKQAKQLIHSAFVAPSVLDFCEKISSIAPKGFEQSFLTSSGSNANELAMRLSWKATGKRGVIALIGGFHGFNLATINASSKAEYKKGFSAGPNVTFIPSPYCYRCQLGLKYPSCKYRCAYSLQDAITYGGGHDAACLILESVQGNGGHVGPPSGEYFKILSKICKKNNMFLIVDEVQTGMGRVGKPFATQLYDIPADIITMGKGLGGGMPVGVTLIKNHVLKKAKTGTLGDIKKQQILFSGTHSMDPLIAATCTAVIEYAENKNLAERANKLGQYLTTKLKQLQKMSKIIGEIRGPGLFVGVEFVKDLETKEPYPEAVSSILTRAFDKGVLFATGGIGQVVKIKPPITIEKKHLDTIINVLTECVNYFERSR